MRPRDPVRAGIVGLGAIGATLDRGGHAGRVLTHAGAYSADPGTTLVAGADVDAVRRKAFRDNHPSAGVYSDFADMFAAAELDVVSICTPVELRLEVVGAAVAAGVRAILCEKPIAVDVEHALALRSAVQRAGVPFLVGYFRRWDAATMDMREQIRAGRLGEIQRVVASYGKGLLHNGSHLLDLIAFLLGRATSVRALSVRDDGRPRAHGATLDALFTVDGPEGSFPAYFVGSDYRRFAHFELDILGTLGRAQLIDSGRAWVVSSAVDDPEYAGYRTLAELSRRATDSGAGIRGAVAELVAFARGRTGSPTCGLDDGLYALEACSAAERSLVEGQPAQITIPHAQH